MFTEDRLLDDVVLTSLSTAILNTSKDETVGKEVEQKASNNQQHALIPEEDRDLRCALIFQ